jgi:hypothetical protein
MRMPDFTSLEKAMHRAVLLAGGVCLALIAMSVACLTFAFVVAGNARDVGARMPVLVVPGAVSGVYSPGLTEDNVRATARYLAGLATNFGSGKSFEERFDELETFSAPTYLAKLQEARATLHRDVETQNQARSFFPSPGTESLHQDSPGRFTYAIRGERIVYASGLPMTSRESEVRLQLLWSAPSNRNRTGILLEGFDVTDSTPGAPAEGAAHAMQRQS